MYIDFNQFNGFNFNVHIKKQYIKYTSMFDYKDACNPHLK